MACEVAHYSRLAKVVIDVPPADHDRELAFWSAAAGQPLTRFDRHLEYRGAALHGQEFWLLVRRRGCGPGRVHLDIRTDGLPAGVTRLENLGAERVQRAGSRQVMRDPAGSLCCVIPEPPGAFSDGHAHRWGLIPPGHLTTHGPSDCAAACLRCLRRGTPASP